MIESFALTSKEVSESTNGTVFESGKREVSELPEKIGSPSEAEALPEKIELISEDDAHIGLDGVTNKTDDNGNIYIVDGKLLPNATYELNGNIYITDDHGRIICCEAKPQLSPENPRDIYAQRQVGGDDRKPGDQGGHIVGRDIGGDGGDGNLIAMDSKINQSDYKRMENDIKKALEEGKDVAMKTVITYSDDSERPGKITETVTYDGKDTIYKYDNNIDGALSEDVPENGKETVQAELDDTGGEISSIKEEYDQNGDLVETTVYITYIYENGTNHRTKVVIENKYGGK